MVTQARACSDWKRGGLSGRWEGGSAGRERKGIGLTAWELPCVVEGS